MSSVNKHYDEVLADVYSWMFGGFEAGVQRNIEFIDKNNLNPRKSGLAVDLGAGCGFQSIPLAKSGYFVTAIDLNAGLLSELEKHRGNLPIHCVQDDLMNFSRYVKNNVELVVCMTDTFLHLESGNDVKSLFSKVHDALEAGGKFIVTFRDLTFELKETDRFLPVRSDDNTIFTCFLEYEPESVKVHDIVYKKSDGSWNLFKSYYRKLRLSRDWVEERLSECGFNEVNSNVENGLITIIAVKY